MALVDRYGQDRNPLLQGLINPVPGIGVIPGKAFLDWSLVDEFRANADDNQLSGKYPGGSQDINHDVMPGMLLLGLRGSRNTDVMDGQPNEKCIAGVAGLAWEDYKSTRNMEDQFYFVGVAATEYRVSRPMDSTTYDPDHGLATIRAGTVSVINNGNHVVYPNQWLQWRLPQTTNHHDVNVNARQGTPPSQIGPELVPFDYTDFNIQMADAFVRMQNNKGPQGGIQDRPLGDFFERFGAEDSRVLSCADETALALRSWIGGTVMRGVEVLARVGYITINDVLDPATEGDAATGTEKLASAIGLTSDKDQNTLLKIVAATLMRTLHAHDPLVQKEMEIFQKNHLTAPETPADAASNPDTTSKAQFNRLVANLPEFGTAGITGCWYHQTQKIIGKTMNAAAVSDTTHLMLGHFCV